MILRHKIFITFAFLVLIPLTIVGIAVHEIFKTSKSQEMITKTENSIIQLNQSLDLMMEDASRNTLSLLYNEQLINILRNYHVNTPSHHRNSSHSNTFSLFLSGILFNKSQIFGVHVFTNNGQVFSHMDDYSIKDVINLKTQKWYNIAKEKEGDWIIYLDENPVYYQDKNKRKYVSFIRQLRDPINKKQLGVIKIDFSPEYLNQLTEQLPSKNWQISRDGESLFKKSVNNILAKCETNRSWIKDNGSNQEYLCITHTSNKTGIQISNVILKDSLYSEIENFNNVLISLIVLCLIISLFLSYYMSIYLLKPLEILKTRIKEFQRNKVPNEINIQSKGEIGELSGAYNDMLSEINYLVAEMYEMNLRNSEAEYKALQFRMDPHFIFNALESINMSAISNNQLELSDMISELGKLIRYRLKNEDQMIFLYEEINFAKLYVNIMKRRLGDALNIHWSIQDTVDNCLVPKYIIQPLIKNAINHGYKNDTEKLSIYVKIKLEKTTLIISVRDDGAGIESNYLQKLKEVTAHSPLNKEYPIEQGKRKHGIALENISERLKLIYGINSNLSIRSELNNGTRIDIVIPIKE